MIDLYLATNLATKAARAAAGSARPDAPVVTERPAGRRSRRHSEHCTRARAAAALHRLASALEPALEPALESAEAPDRRVRVRPSTAHQ